MPFETKKLTLFRSDLESENEKAEKMLEEAGLDFRQIFATSDTYKPTLFVEGETFPHTGLDQIKQYCDFVTEQRAVSA